MRNWYKDLDQDRATYSEYLKSDYWKNKRRQVLQRDNYSCNECGVKSNLQVHHLDYDTIGDEDLEDLITLCRKCHHNLHEIINRKKQEQRQAQKERWEQEALERKERLISENKAKWEHRIWSEKNEFDSYFDGFKLRIDKIHYYNSLGVSKEINLDQFEIIKGLLDRFSKRPELQIKGLVTPLLMVEQLKLNFENDKALPNIPGTPVDFSKGNNHGIIFFKKMPELVEWLFGKRYKTLMINPNKCDCRCDFFYWPNCECDKRKLGLLREDRLDKQKEYHYQYCKVCGQKGRIVRVSRLTEQQKQECYNQRTIVS